jgi:putative ABC transport system permease protein
MGRYAKSERLEGKKAEGLFGTHGFTAGILNWASFSCLAFSSRVRPAIIASGVVFSLLMGMIGGLPPAVRALRLPIITALREL